MFYHALDQFAGCVVIWNNGSLLCNEIWERVTVEYKRVVISYTQPLSTIAIIASYHLCFLAFSRIVLFPSTTDPPTGISYGFLSYKDFYWWRKF